MIFIGNNELSKKALSNTEKLIQKYVIETKNGEKQGKKEKDKLTDEFALTLNALISLMTEIDKAKVLKLLEDYDILIAIKKSIRRIQCNKSLAFT